MDNATELMELRTRIIALERDVVQAKIDIRTLLDFVAGMKMLLTLSIGGGALSVVNLILLLLNLIKEI